MTDVDRDRALEEGHLWLGRAISGFSRVEVHLGRVYRACFLLENTPVAMHAYLAAEDTNLRRKMTSRAVFYSIDIIGNPRDLNERWRQISSEAQDLATRRNHLAHGEVQYRKALAEEERKVVVLPYAHTQPYGRAAVEYLKGQGRSPKGIWDADRKPVSLHEVQDFVGQCERITLDMREFARELEAALLSLREYTDSPSYHPP